jgi:Lrp/AsnC family transcriptional regulator, leucine-responsive regulatory protein
MIPKLILKYLYFCITMTTDSFHRRKPNGAAMKLDAVDRKLLALVQQDSSLPYATLGRGVGLSVSAVNERVRKLERSGAIRGYVALIDPAVAGAEVLAFVEVSLASAASPEAFLIRAAARPEVLEAHRISGERQLLLKLRAASLEHLEVLIDELLGGGEVASSRVTLVLRSAKEGPALPIIEAPADT